MSSHPSTIAARRRRNMKRDAERRKAYHGFRYNHLMDLLGMGFGHGQPLPSGPERDKRVAYYCDRAELSLPLFDGSPWQRMTTRH